jgi:tripartite-type tricarboxylate transporter receptor subunit TctC
MFKLSRWALAALALIAFDVYSPAFGQTYPSRPITIVVPLAAGTGMDVIARMYGEKLSQSLGKPVIIENKPGASLMLAAVAVATAPPDGHTLLISTSSAMSINPTLFKKINYDPEKDFAPVSWYLKSPFILVVNPALPIQSVPDLIKYAKASAVPLAYSSPGPGVAQHLSIEFMKQRFGLDMNHIPYRSTPQSLVDISTGQVHLAFAEAGASLPLIKDGRLRALAVSALTRLPVLPDVPPFAEASGAADFEAVSWHMLLAPAKTPREIVVKLHEEMKRIMSDKDMQQRMALLGLIPIDPPSIEVTEQYLKSEKAKWSALVKKLGLEGSQ